MGLSDLIIIATGLSMDSFAVAIGIGLSRYRFSCKRATITGVFFGGFQGLMLLAGFLLAVNFKDYLTAIDHWVAFVLLAIIGGRMIHQSSQEQIGINKFSIGNMTALSIATSIDALAVGVTLAFLEVRILAAVLVIGITAFAFSFAGVKIGHIFGSRFKATAVCLGGSILVLLAFKILLEHMLC